MSRIVYIECDGCGKRLSPGASVVVITAVEATVSDFGDQREAGLDVYACSLECSDLISIHVARAAWIAAERRRWLGDPNQGWKEAEYDTDRERCRFRHLGHERRCINQAGHDPVQLPHHSPAPDDPAGYGCPFQRVEAENDTGTLVSQCMLPLGHGEPHDFDTSALIQSWTVEKKPEKLPSTIPPPETHGESAPDENEGLPLPDDRFRFYK